MVGGRAQYGGFGTAWHSMVVDSAQHGTAWCVTVHRMVSDTCQLGSFSDFALKDIKQTFKREQLPVERECHARAAFPAVPLSVLQGGMILCGVMARVDITTAKIRSCVCMGSGLFLEGMPPHQLGPC